MSASIEGVLERMLGLCGVLMDGVCTVRMGLHCGMPKWGVGKRKVASDTQ